MLGLCVALEIYLSYFLNQFFGDFFGKEASTEFECQWLWCILFQILAEHFLVQFQPAGKIFRIGVLKAEEPDFTEGNRFDHLRRKRNDKMFQREFHPLDIVSQRISTNSTGIHLADKLSKCYRRRTRRNNSLHSIIARRIEPSGRFSLTH